MYSKIVTSIILFCITNLFFFALTCSADVEEMRYEDVLNIVKACERKIDGFRWKVKMENSSAPIAGQNSNAQETAKDPAFAEVLLDFHAKRFRVEEKKQEYGVMKDHSIERFAFEGSTAYDGLNFSAWKKSTPQNQGTNIFQGSSGEITGDLANSVVARRFLDGGGLANVGLRTGVPCLFVPDLIKSDARFFSEFFSEWKEKGKLVALFRQDNGDMIVYAKIYPEHMKNLVAKIVYSPEKNGIITEYSTLLSYSRETGDGELFSRWIVHCKPNQDGDWYPTVMSLTMPLLGQNGYSTAIHFEEFEYLSKIPENEFQVTFPLGTEVSDHVAKMCYEVGDPVNEDQAVDEFIQRYGLTGDVPKRIRGGGYTVVRYTLMGIGLSMILFALFRIFQNWRKS